MRELANTRGFTLIEVLVALAIFGVLSALAYMTLAASIIWFMLAATAVRESATIVRATMTSISVNPLDRIIFTELNLA